MIRHGAILTIAGLLAVSSAEAARLPDWAIAVGAEAPEIPPGVPATATRILLSETRYSVQPDGTYRIRRRVAVQALSATPEGVGVGSYRFDDTAQIVATRAWHLPHDELTARKSHTAPMDFAVGDEFLTGSKVRLVPVANVKKGSLLFFEFEAREKPYFLTLTSLFLDTVPVALTRFEVELPAGWSARWAWLQGKGPEPIVAGPLRTWEIKDIPAAIQEDLAPAPDEIAPLLGLNLSPPSGAGVSAAVFSDWAAVSRWYDEMAKGRAAVTPAIEATARRGQDDGGASNLDRMLASATSVRDRVRYVAVELGIGGYQPRPAGETLSNLYGDCKDKAILLQSILAAGGITSYPLLVNLGGRMSLSPEIPIWAFNHLVLAAAIPQDVALPAGYESTVVTDPDFGRLLVLDSTHEFAPAGSLPAPLAGQQAVLVAGNRGKLITLPRSQASSHRVERRLDLTLTADRRISAHAESRLFGEFASGARADYQQSSVDRRRRTEGRYAQLWPGATLEDYAVEPETTEGAFVERCAISGIPLESSGSTVVLPLFPGASWDLARVPLGKRKNPVEYAFPRTLSYRVDIEGLPQATLLPDSQKIEGEGWAVETRIHREGSRIEALWEVRLSRERFDPASFAELRKFWNAAALLDGALVQFTP